MTILRMEIDAEITLVIVLLIMGIVEYYMSRIRDRMMTKKTVIIYGGVVASLISAVIGLMIVIYTTNIKML